MPLSTTCSALLENTTLILSVRCMLTQVTVHVWSVSALKGFYQDAVYSRLKGADGSIDLFQFIVCDAVGWKDVDDVA